ncbi:hypothetical protein EVAR_69019_1 [Eumeta japonica]|uniref:Uncharacterized protein n=1 Tax=Eumeta variegata TaxID=151549 RepID=A0A4C2A5M1_EUMVA|nr:hypothetical protein EVAR_69019_1 [Eumeta japonica]
MPRLRIVCGVPLKVKYEKSDIGEMCGLIKGVVIRMEKTILNRLNHLWGLRAADYRCHPCDDYIRGRDLTCFLEAQGE